MVVQCERVAVVAERSVASCSCFHFIHCARLGSLCSARLGSALRWPCLGCIHCRWLTMWRAVRAACTCQTASATQSSRRSAGTPLKGEAENGGGGRDAGWRQRPATRGPHGLTHSSHGHGAHVLHPLGLAIAAGGRGGWGRKELDESGLFRRGQEVQSVTKVE